MLKIKILAFTTFLLSIVLSVHRCEAAGVQWGVYLGDGNISRFESLVGNPANIQAVFTGWGNDDDFPTEYKAAVANTGKTLLVFWEPSVDYDSILSGQWDGYLASFAASAKNYGGQVILVPFGEMNGNWDIWGGTVGGNTPQKMINAWRYVHKFFTLSSNVKFGWDVNNESVPDTKANAISAYYPGDAYVDYVGISGFNFGNPWQSWQSVFSAPISTVKQYNKPVYIFSTASSQGAGKAQWIADMGAGVSQYGIAGWVWFNENKECDWLVGSDTASFSAFQAITAQAGRLTMPSEAVQSATSSVANAPSAPVISTASSVAGSATKTTNDHHGKKLIRN